MQCDRGHFVSLVVPKAGTGKECLVCPEGAICSGGTAMPFPKAGWWIDRSSYVAGSVAFRCTRATCEGFAARAHMWAKRVRRGGGSFAFGGLAAFNDEAYDLDDDGATADDDYVGLSGAAVGPLGCWHRAAFVNASAAADAQGVAIYPPQCSDRRLMCAHGSVGPLCGSCAAGFVFSSSTRLCVNCNRPLAYVPALLLGLFLVAVVAVRSTLLKVHKQGRHAPLRHKLSAACPLLFGDGAGGEGRKHKNANPFRHVDRGMLKVAWATLQILSTVSWNLAVQYPEPFASALESLSFMSLDFSAALTCSSEMGLLARTLFAALVPLGLGLLDLVLFLARSARRASEARRAASAAAKEHAFRPASGPLSSGGGASYGGAGTPRPYGSRTRPRAPSIGSFSFFAGRVGGVLWHRGESASGSFDPYLAAALERMRNQHVYFALALSYLVTALPHPCSSSFSNTCRGTCMAMHACK